MRLLLSFLLFHATLNQITRRSAPEAQEHPIAQAHLLPPGTTFHPASALQQPQIRS
jgi:hypothetical protein